MSDGNPSERPSQVVMVVVGVVVTVVVVDDKFVGSQSNSGHGQPSGQFSIAFGLTGGHVSFSTARCAQKELCEDIVLAS